MSLGKGLSWTLALLGREACGLGEAVEERRDLREVASIRRGLKRRRNPESVAHGGEPIAEGELRLPIPRSRPRDRSAGYCCGNGPERGRAEANAALHFPLHDSARPRAAAAEMGLNAV